MDLDASGVGAMHVSAFDLLYTSALAVLRLVPETDREPFFRKLRSVYAPDEQDGLSAASALEGLAGLSTAAGAAAAGLTAEVRRLSVRRSLSRRESCDS